MVQSRYALNDVTVTKASILRVESILGPDVLSIGFKHNLGIYSDLNNDEIYYWFQDMTLDPPTFPVTRNNKSV